MLFNFDTENESRARAALILYAVYRSRNKNSPLNGIETWDRFSAFVHAACLKSVNTPAFIETLCHKAKVDSIKPKYLDTGDPVKIGSDGLLISSDAIKNYHISVMEDDSLLPYFRDETTVLMALVRERIQREKFEEDHTDENNND